MNEAEALQFHYTSCRNGVSGYAGFQTRAESPGLPLSERRELEAKAIYQPPRDLPRDPDNEIIAQQFPKAFKTLQLSSGRLALMRSCYIGKDYSGRWGNYFSHGLVLPMALRDHWPIDAYAWSGWQESLVDDQFEPVPLPGVPLDQLTKARDFSFPELSTFLGEGKGRVEILSRMISAVFCRAKDSRSLVIREHLELDAVYWIACIQKAFPPACQMALTCSTYQFDPRTAQAINSTVGETDFLLDEGERRYQFYVFDFVGQQHSEVPGEQVEYARTVSAWMANDPQRLQAFHEFCSLFDKYTIGPELAHVLRFFRLAHGEAVKLSASDLRAVLSLASAQARSTDFGRVVAAVGDLALGLDTATPSEDWVLVLRFLADCAAATGQAEQYRLVCLAWRRAFDQSTVRRQVADHIVLAFRAELKEKLGPHAAELSQVFLEEEYLEGLWARAAQCSPQVLGIVLQQLDESCRQLQVVPSYRTQAVQNLFEAALIGAGSREDFAWALSPFNIRAGDVENVVILLVTLLQRQVAERTLSQEELMSACWALGRSLHVAMLQVDEDFRFGLLNRLKGETRFHGVLHGEWQAHMKSTPDKAAAHERYVELVLSDDSSYAQSMRDKLAHELWEMVPSNRREQLAREWVDAGKYRNLPPDLVRVVFDMAAQTLKLTPGHQASEALEIRIRQGVSELQSTEYPLKIALRTWVKNFLNDLPVSTSECGPVLAAADAQTRMEFMRAILGPLLDKAHSGTQHGKLMRQVVFEGQERLLEEAYMEYLAGRPENRLDTADAAGLEFWLCSNAEAAGKRLGAMRGAVVDAWALRLAHMPDDVRTRFKQVFRGRTIFKDPAMARLAESFFARVDEYRPSWLGRLVDHGKSFLGFAYGKKQGR